MRFWRPFAEKQNAGQNESKQRDGSRITAQCQTSGTNRLIKKITDNGTEGRVKMNAAQKSMVLEMLVQK